MRLFKRKPKKCDNISFAYNYLKPEKGVQICLGAGEDKKLPGLSEYDIAYYNAGVEELKLLVGSLQDILSKFERHGN